jgi:hypothetical protein
MFLLGAGIMAESTNSPELPYLYDAFISYRHVDRDRKWAKWLIEALESYGLPKALQDRGFPLRLRKLFRDVDEAPASSDLNDAIKQALVDSRFLIVVCSPYTPRSKWVERELSDITAGSYVGATAVKQADGNLKALEVHIFPETARGTGEGHRPYDLQPGSTMTNANVEQVDQIAVEKVQGQMITLKYKGGEQKVFIPPGTPIVKNVAADRSLLKAGTGVFIPAVQSEDGTLTAIRITVGVGGVMPPM